jgi:hypothetical protein
LGRRILKEDHTGASVVTWLYTYDGQKVVGEYDDSGASPVLARYYVDGAGYIDEHVLVNQQTGAQAGEYYYLLKELYSVAGLANANGEIVEAYDYDAYGKVRIFTTGLGICDGFGDFDGDCDVDIADFEALQLCRGWRPAGRLPQQCGRPGPARFGQRWGRGRHRPDRVCRGVYRAAGRALRRRRLEQQRRARSGGL